MRASPRPGDFHLPGLVDAWHRKLAIGSALGLTVVAMAAEPTAPAGAIGPTIDNPAPSVIVLGSAQAETPLGQESKGIANKDVKPRIPKHIIFYANAASGYITGNLTSEDSFVASGLEEKDHHKRTWLYGMALHKGQPEDNECVWIKQKEVSVLRTKSKPGICEEQKKALGDRDTIGKSFNCGDHLCDDGSHKTKLKEACQEEQLPLNYNQKTGKGYDKLPQLEMVGDFKYRYTTPDGAKAVGRVTLRLPGGRQENLWVFPRESCVIGERTSGPELDYGTFKDNG